MIKIVPGLAARASLCILLALFGVTFPALGQDKIKSFSKNKEAYSAELLTFLKDIEKEKPKWEALHLEFTGKLSNNLFSDQAFSNIVDVSNNLLKKRIVDFDTWNYFLRSTVLLHENEDPKHAEPWLEDLVSFSKKERNGITAVYLRTMYQSLSEQTLFNDGSLRWKAPDATWVFSYDGEPQFQVSAADVWGYFKSDSTVLEGTEGVFYPKSLIFKGRGGTVYWVRTGLSRDSAYATLQNFTMDVQRQDFSADSVMLYSKLYVKEPLMGRFEERLSSRSEEKNASFPRFTSYRQDLGLTDVYPNVDFVGGISVIGRKYYGSGAPENKATLLFKFEGKPVITAKSERIWFRQDILTSEATQITIRLKTDSIYHPKSSLRFIPAQNQLTLNRDNEGLSLSPYSDTYHNLDIFFDVLNWKLNEPQLHLGNLNLGAASPVIFESHDYYRGELMDQIKGLDQEVGPLKNIAKVCEAYGRKTLTLEEMARGLAMQKEATHRFMLQMSIGGFVNYDQASQTITVRDKLFNYIQNERGKRDYDVIRFVSGLESGANASISLLSFDMDIRGISVIALSDSQEVALFPKGQKITVHEGLNFDFDGRITAGRFSFWGSQFYFDYNNFQMNMPSIDSMRFKVLSFEKDINGNRWLVDVKNVLQNINGELIIDKSNNKSGRTRYTEYPIFRSGKESYVYYDRKSIFNSVYNREEFFVTLEPFEIDSLDNTSTQGLKFAGVLNSAGIFPDIAENIMVQEDYSLGFKTATPEGGFPGYGGKGRYTGAISLSNKGLKGDGNIKYLTSTAVSNELFFFPDSTNGKVQTYEILPQIASVEYPHVTATDVNMNWRPYQDVFYTTSTTTPFAMYDDVGMQARGTLALGPSKLGGRGVLDFLDAQTNSLDFTFRNRQFDSPAMAFKVRANPTAAWGFELKNARGFVNFDKQKGEFTVNDAASYLSFPINQYIAYMDFAEWKIPQKSIEVKKLGGAALSHMVSVHPKQDSLQFMAGSAKFSLVPSLLEGFDIPKIEVADANIIPDTGYVAIEPQALMRTLTKAQIIANRTQQFHKFYEATVNVKARNVYQGSGMLDYIDEDQTPWPLYFESIKHDTSKTTIGLANVKTEDNFFLSPFFGYYGKVNLRAPDKNMTFDGYTLIQHQCANIQTTWFKFKSVIDPMKIVITLPEDKSGPNRLFNGIYLAPDSTSGYSAFLSQDNSKADQEILASTGVLYYDKAIYSYVITAAEKVSNPRAAGNYLALNNRDCYTTGKGGLAFADKAGRIELQSHGIVTHQLNNDAMVLDMVLGFEFFFNEDILKETAKRLQESSSLKASDNNREAYKVAVDNLLTDKEKEKYEEEVSLFGAPEKLPRAFRKTISFSELVLEFNPETNSFVSSGDIGIGSMLGEQINKKVTGVVEIARKRRGDEVTIYLELGGSNDFIFFQYKRNVMTFYSTDKALMQKIQEMDPEKRSLAAKEGLPPYTYNTGTKGKVSLFLERFQ